MKKVMMAVLVVSLTGCSSMQSVPDASLYMNAEKQNISDACMADASKNARDLTWIANCKKGQGLYEAAKRTCASMYSKDNTVAKDACVGTTYRTMSLK